MILALCGFSRVGKNAAADCLENYQQFSFAEVLKQEVTKMLASVGIKADVYKEDKEAWRDMLVFWGRKRRSLDRDYWVKQVAMRIAAKPYVRAVITDLRYVNEARWVKSKGGLVIGIERPGFGPANEEEGMSIREIRIQHSDIHWLVNDGTPGQLATSIRSAVKQFCSNKFVGGSEL